MSNNPKLNNVLKGWRAAQHDWIILADCNVLMPPRLYPAAVCKLAGGYRPGRFAAGRLAGRDGIWAELECAFLNTYQARWQYVADAFGFGFAQGKTMLWRRADLNAPAALRRSPRKSPKTPPRPRLCAGPGSRCGWSTQPFPQPLGDRSAAEIWHRQMRWARLRRASFFLCFLPEALSSGLVPVALLAGIAPAIGRLEVQGS